MRSKQARHVGVLHGANRSGSIAGRIHDARITARSYVAAGKQRALELEEGLDEYIQEHPVRSILIAAGVGALFGAFVSRR